MTDTDYSLSRTLGEMHETLKAYIEATYHISNESLVRKRLTLLNEPGVIAQEPFIESTPRYQTGRRIEELSLEPEVANALLSLAQKSTEGPQRIFNPLYVHQTEALELSHNDGRSLVVMTGTGSGKTETFMIPILSRLARESSQTSWETPAVRSLVLYPMNALVNDQVSRLRLLMGDPRFAEQIRRNGGRTARFARYTSRTQYPGVRTSKRDGQRLKPVADFYVNLTSDAQQAGESGDRARRLIKELSDRGKWPSKPDFSRWFGEPGTPYQDSATGEWQRAVTLENDVELFTRHEVLESPPDVLVTNYSMLEYMMMRPIERPVFDATRAWLAENPEEKFLLVIDEAHMYRGSQGAEVSLLLRRLRDRLGISPDRLDVICTSASFSDPKQAVDFAAQLSGKDSRDFDAVQGHKLVRPNPASGQQTDVDALTSVNLKALLEADNDRERIQAIEPLLTHLSATQEKNFGETLFAALSEYAPLSLITNATMEAAYSISELGEMAFPAVEVSEAESALTVLLTLASMAKGDDQSVPLFPARAHMFYRGLPGLWACLNPSCPDEAGSGSREDSPVGKLFAQPRQRCDACSSVVMELFTCRACGSAYARGFAHDLENPQYLGSEAGVRFRTSSGEVAESLPLDICLELPHPEADTQHIELDLFTGEVDPREDGRGTRSVFLRSDRLPDEPSDTRESLGRFIECCVCSDNRRGEGSVQDHVTKGEQPFQALVTTQIRVQTPGLEPATDFAPLRGRKVLLFSDSRQTAARLAPNIQDFSYRDAMRPMMLVGLEEMDQILGPTSRLDLNDAYLGVLIGAMKLGVRLRPDLRQGESFGDSMSVQRAWRDGTPDAVTLMDLRHDIGDSIPQSLLVQIHSLLTDRYYSFTELALGAIEPIPKVLEKLMEDLPELPGYESEEARASLIKAWTQQWAVTNAGIWLRGMPTSWWQAARETTGVSVQGHESGRFTKVTRLFGSRNTKQLFENEWAPKLMEEMCERVESKYRLLGRKTRLETVLEWTYCNRCRGTQPSWPGINECLKCREASPRRIDPDTDVVFGARKGFYRNPVREALQDSSKAPLTLQAAEHTAQLNSAEATEVFSRAEIYELLFQDVEIPSSDGVDTSTAIDILSSTTTMEVGIDIGALSGVALRNMPPSRPNYQQRAGRAGRRGSAIATVVAFGSADSHDDHYFSNPKAMIRGEIEDPSLTLDNSDIAWRHVVAFLLQNYLQARLPDLRDALRAGYGTNLFEVLGTVEDFTKKESRLNRVDFSSWVREETGLQERLDSWLPQEIPLDERKKILSTYATEAPRRLDAALRSTVITDESLDAEDSTSTEDDAVSEEYELACLKDNSDFPLDELAASDGLLNRLLYKGVLPQYAFPTDVAPFHVFDKEKSSQFRQVSKYSPSQSLQVALTQYAPGKEVTIDGKKWTSGALYSLMRQDRDEAWNRRRIYLACSECGYAMTASDPDVSNVGEAPYQRKESYDCPACESHNSFGVAMRWLRPPGFAHPVDHEAQTHHGEIATQSYATRAKLIEFGSTNDQDFRTISHGLRHRYNRSTLVVTNAGPNDEGYDYCLECGRIAPSAEIVGNIRGRHNKPTPDSREPVCPNESPARNIVLGMDFEADVLLASLSFEKPVQLIPGQLATQIALRTASEGLVKAGTQLLQLDSNELAAEFRPALSGGGPSGREAEIYMYDTLSGGAGFTRRLESRSAEVYEKAASLLESCPDDCDQSCYRCLRSFGNRFEHDRLDRHLGADLLRHVLTRGIPQLTKQRETRALELLAADLSRQSGIEVEQNAGIRIDGVVSMEVPLLVTGERERVVVGIHHPLTPRYLSDPQLRDLTEFSLSTPVIAIDELVVLRNLPAASRRVLQAL